MGPGCCWLWGIRFHEFLLTLKEISNRAFLKSTESHLTENTASTVLGNIALGCYYDDLSALDCGLECHLFALEKKRQMLYIYIASCERQDQIDGWMIEFYIQSKNLCFRRVTPCDIAVLLGGHYKMLNGSVSREYLKSLSTAQFALFPLIP